MSSDYTNYPPPDQSIWREVKGEEHKPGEPEAAPEPSEKQPLRSEETSTQQTQSRTQKLKAVFSGMRTRTPTSTEQSAPFPHTGTYPPSEKAKSLGLRCCFDDKATQPPPEGSLDHFRLLWNTRKDLIKDHAASSFNEESFKFLSDMENYRKFCDNKKASNKDIAEEYNTIVDENFKHGTALVSHSELPEKIDVDSIDSSKKTRKALREKLDAQEVEVLRLFSESFFKGNTYNNSKNQ